MDISKSSFIYRVAAQCCGADSIKNGCDLLIAWLKIAFLFGIAVPASILVGVIILNSPVHMFRLFMGYEDTIPVFLYGYFYTIPATLLAAAVFLLFRKLCRSINFV